MAVAIFAISAAILGPWLERRGPLRGGLLGASLFYFGNLLTALGVYVNAMPLIFIGYGVFAGAGLGISYISPVSPLQKWFPEMRGVAGGLAVCGFGAGSIFSPFTQQSTTETLAMCNLFISFGNVLLLTSSLWTGSYCENIKPILICANVFCGFLM